MSFPCTGCGACCKRVDKLSEMLGADKDNPESKFYFPFTWDATGRCENLKDDNSCAVYETRPVICNVDAMAETFGLTQKEYYNINIKGCNVLMDELKVPKSFRIKPII